MQTARKTIGAALALVELATRVQTRENQFNDRGVFFRMQAERNATSIVFDADGAIRVQHHLDLLSMPGERLVSGVVQRLLDHVQRSVGAGVHARSLLDRLQALQDADR